MPELWVGPGFSDPPSVPPAELRQGAAHTNAEAQIVGPWLPLTLSPKLLGQPVR